MRVFNIIRVALRALRRNLLRSALTALGIIIGVAAVITMVGIGTGARVQVEQQIASLGQNIVSVYPGASTSGASRGGWGSSSTLTVEDALAISKEVSGILAVSPEVRDRMQVVANGSNWRTQVSGVDPSYLDIRSWPLDRGQMFNEFDVRGATKVCVIGRTVADQLFPDVDPIGETLRIRNIPFRIQGILKSKGFNFFGRDEDDIVLTPYMSHLKRISRKQYLNAILMQAADPDSMENVQQDVESLLRQRRQGREPDFTVRNQQELAASATATTKTMTLLLGAIAGVSLVVGGIGIMNIMLVSVTERTREIGIRLAIGAHGRDVLMQFLIEAVVLSLLGGLLGVLLGVGASQLIASLNNWPVLLSVEAVIGAVGFSAAIGIFFGYYPARKAAQLDPIEALRFE